MAQSLELEFATPSVLMLCTPFEYILGQVLTSNKMQLQLGHEANFFILYCKKGISLGRVKNDVSHQAGVGTFYDAI